MTTGPAVREATVDDAEAIGSIHVRAWQAIYRGVMPDEYLDGLRAEDRAGRARHEFRDIGLTGRIAGLRKFGEIDLDLGADRRLIGGGRSQHDDGAHTHRENRSHQKCPL